MLNKEKQLKKIFMQRITITGLMLCVLITVSILFSNYSDDLATSKTTLENQNNSLMGEKQNIEKILSLSDNYLRNYNFYVHDHNKDFEIRRNVLSEMLPALRKQHHFANNMEATISAAVEMTDPAFKIKTGTVWQSTVKLTFSALSDNSVYNFIYDLQHKLPGIIIVSEIKLSRTSDISAKTLAMAVDNHAITPVVNGEMYLAWLGIRKEK